MILNLVLIGLIGYFIGSLNFSRIISKRLMHDDITKHGSGNPGTTNMYRTYGWKVGVATLVLDILKGVVPTLVCLLVFGYDAAFISGTSAVLGHIFPVIYKFKGGKGIATTLGVFAVICPLWLLIVLVVMGVLIYFFQYMAPVSLSAIAFLVCLQAHRFAGNVVICTCVFVIFLLTWFAHRKNIVRMLSGSENRVVIRKRKPKKTDKQNV